MAKTKVILASQIGKKPEADKLGNKTSAETQAASTVGNDAAANEASNAGAAASGASSGTTAPPVTDPGTDPHNATGVKGHGDEGPSFQKGSEEEPQPEPQPTSGPGTGFEPNDTMATGPVNDPNEATEPPLDEQMQLSATEQEEERKNDPVREADEQNIVHADPGPEVKPHRTKVKHSRFNDVFDLPDDVADMFARNPKFYDTIYNPFQHRAFPVTDFVWLDEDGTDQEVVGS